MPDTTHDGVDPMGAPASHRGPLANCPAPDCQDRTMEQQDRTAERDRLVPRAVRPLDIEHDELMARAAAEHQARTAAEKARKDDDRTTVLREAADELAEFIALHGPTSRTVAGWRGAIGFLRRLAAESQQQKPTTADKGAKAEPGSDTASDTPQHSCGNCEGIHPDTCLMNPRRRQNPGALDRIRRLHDALAEETDLSGPDDLITKGSAARRIAAALDGWSPAAESQPEPETACRNCRGSGLDPRHNGEFDCPDCTPAAGVRRPGDETPCGPAPDQCDAEAGEPCADHERQQAHAEGEHAFCGPECSEAEPTAEGIVREHVTTLHLIGEQLTGIESWMWEHLAHVRNQPAAAADETAGEATIAELAHALDNSTPYPVELDRALCTFMAERLLEMLAVSKRPAHAVWQPEEPPGPCPEPMDPETLSARLRCPQCGEDITDYAEDDHVFRAGDERPYCSGECVVAVHQAADGTGEGDRIAAYRAPVSNNLYCAPCGKSDRSTPLTSEDLPDGGLCAGCGVDVLIPQEFDRG